jgi:hypothetical protein
VKAGCFGENGVSWSAWFLLLRFVQKVAGLLICMFPYGIPIHAAKTTVPDGLKK